MGHCALEGELNMNRSRLILPPESMPWGRSVDEQLRASELAQSNLNTTVQTMNTQLGSVTSTVGFLLDQQAFVTAATGDSSSYQKTLNSSADNEFNYATYDPNVDCRVLFTTSSTGQITYQVSGNVSALSENYVATVALIGIEIFEGAVADLSKSVFSTTYGLVVRSQSSYINNTVAAAGTIHGLALKPNTQYLLETWRGWFFNYEASVGGAQTAKATWSDRTSVLVTKVGK